MTKLTKTLLVVSLLLYFLFRVVSNVPATLLVSIVHGKAPSLWLNSVEGTIWNGRAGAAQLNIKQRGLALGRVSWKLSPLSLLMLNPCMTFETSQPGQSISGELCSSIGGSISVKDLTADGSMAFINSFVKTELKGRASLSVQHGKFSLDDSRVESLSAQLSWHNARVLVMGEWLTLGSSYAAKFKESAKGGISAEVFSLEAPLKLEMTADWLPSEGVGGITADGILEPNDNTPAKIREGIQLIGEEVEPGKYRFSWR